jgi:hypothetical protein
MRVSESLAGRDKNQGAAPRNYRSNCLDRCAIDRGDLNHQFDPYECGVSCEALRGSVLDDGALSAYGAMRSGRLGGVALLFRAP